MTLYDQNVQVHLPAESISTVIEEKALCMLLELFNLDGDEWQGRTFTTGATAGNILGLACGREFVLQNALEKLGKGSSVSVGDDGLVKACLEAGIEEINVLSVLGHSSLKKAASVVGLGRGCVKDVGRVDGEFWFDLELLEGWLKKDKALSIVVISCGEVNTGGFATHSVEDVKTIRELCDKYGAWLHVDGGMLHYIIPQSSAHRIRSVRSFCSRPSRCPRVLPR